MLDPDPQWDDITQVEYSLNSIYFYSILAYFLLVVCEAAFFFN